MKYYYKILVNNLLLTPRNYTEEHHLILCKDRSKHNKNKKKLTIANLVFYFIFDGQHPLVRRTQSILTRMKSFVTFSHFTLEKL